MNRLTSVLTVALALQLLLAAALFWPRQDQAEEDTRAPLLSPSLTIDRIVISDADDTVLLSRQSDGWRLPEYHNLPADSTRVERVATTLPALPRGWPVASTAGAAARFEVAKDDYQRRVEYFSGESPLGTVYIGTSPGFRRVHARLEDADAVYAVAFNAFDLPADANGWLDKRLLQARDVTAVDGLDYQLTKSGETWQGRDGRVPDADAVDDLVNGLESLRVTGVADIATAAVLEDMAAPPTLTVASSGGSYDYRLYETEDTYYVQRNDIPVFFTLSAYDYDRLNDVTAEILYPPDENDAEAAAEEVSDDDTGDTE